jgi:hypothetical protein
MEVDDDVDPPSLLCLSPNLSRFSDQNLSKIDLISYFKLSMTCASLPFVHVFYSMVLFLIYFLFSCVSFLSLFVFSLDLISIAIYVVTVLSLYKVLFGQSFVFFYFFSSSKSLTDADEFLSI